MGTVYRLNPDILFPCPKCGCDNRWQIVVDEDTEDDEGWEAREYRCAACGERVEMVPG